MQQRRHMVRLGVIILALCAYALPSTAQDMRSGMGTMGGMAMADAPMPPPVHGYSEGEAIFFLHTEASDSKIAEILTEMMRSPVPVVPSLARSTAEMTAPVYVFTNGIGPDGPRGPLGYQPDVFGHPPGSPGYTPLRRIVEVTWKDGATPRLLTAAKDIKAAAEEGSITLGETDVIVNMPMVTWPGGQR